MTEQTAEQAVKNAQAELDKALAALKASKHSPQEGQPCDCCGEETFVVYNERYPYPYLCSDYCKKRYKFGKCEKANEVVSAIQHSLDKQYKAIGDHGDHCTCYFCNPTIQEA